MIPRANYTPLTPQSFLTRSARVYPGKSAVIYRDRQQTYREFYGRVCRFAQALLDAGLRQGGSVAIIAPNTPAHLEAAFGALMAGAVIAPINTRLNPQEVAYIVKHCDARVLLVDAELLPLAALAMRDARAPRLVVDPGDGATEAAIPAGATAYEDFLAGASAESPGRPPVDENDVMALYYTSGTTGHPKGVMFSHRHAYLVALCNLFSARLTAESRYLWTLPVFHVNGWGFAWSVAAVGATHIGLRRLTPAGVVGQILEHGATHLCGAPIVLQMIADGARELGVSAFPQRLTACTAAAPPSPTIIERMLALNVEVIHVYGLTETGPSAVCEMQPEWARMPLAEKARFMARQGVPGVTAGGLDVLDASMRPVPADGSTMGEVCMRGNLVLRGYHKDAEGSAQALRGGWFHSGDLGVMHPDGYVELRDRAKDIIISGGENISTIEVENVLTAHPAVRDVAVVSRPDERWGEVPVAFITPLNGSALDERDLIAWCRERLAAYKVPKSFLFEELPRTSTGKIQKFLLRERLWEGRDKRIN